eukprot:Cvel_34843.t1-p1 / transcript=Cvel_34843.t1 / gene=Cvel_34843 / organism=Chromera_velia_CCMP2878 / gene_product=hypothetical protein / transcript_product=hypothetical protein / location=Cvel_scaffold6129:2681-3423(+) / protein_length=177 / sequence_SO=supercontig / SO=protein_coding / is_pseudo=false
MDSSRMSRDKGADGYHEGASEKTSHRLSKLHKMISNRKGLMRVLSPSVCVSILVSVLFVVIGSLVKLQFTVEEKFGSKAIFSACRLEGKRLYISRFRMPVYRKLQSPFSGGVVAVDGSESIKAEIETHLGAPLDKAYAMQAMHVSLADVSTEGGETYVEGMVFDDTGRLRAATGVYW